MGARVLIIVSLGALACERRSEKYCMYHPTDLAFCERSDAALDAPTSCMTNTNCTPADPFCEPTSHICVECLTSADCANRPEAPICNPATFECQACVTHADCTTSRACLPDGTCGDDSNVIYVNAGGSDMKPCTMAEPCKTIAHALTLLTATRSYIKLTSNLVETVVIAMKRGTILADPGTVLTGGDPVIKLQMSEFRIFDLTITGGMNCLKSEMGSTTTLVHVTIRGCGKRGIEGKGGYLRVNRCTVAQCGEGGIVLDANADFSITNTFIYLNGTAAKPGGVTIGAATSGTNQFDFNTVVQNVSNTDAGGVLCPETNGMEARDNLIVENYPANTFGCNFATSQLGPDMAPYAFVGGDDYHITALSAARDTALAPSPVSDDFDGQYRPLGTAKDFGADEYKP